MGYYMDENELMQDIEEFNFRFKLDEAIEKIESEGYKHAKSKHKCDSN